MRNKSVEYRREDPSVRFAFVNQRLQEDHGVLHDLRSHTNMESAVPLAKGHDMPPAGKASTVMRQSFNGQPAASHDEVARLHNTLSALTIDKERVSITDALTSF
jgi:hypothetical protein